MFGAVVPLSEPPGIVGVASRQSEPMDTPRIKTPALATVYLDEEAVGLMGDPRPKVSKIVAAGGKRLVCAVLFFAVDDAHRGPPACIINGEDEHGENEAGGMAAVVEPVLAA